MKREIICLSCPIGCRLVVERGDHEDSDAIQVSGNQCNRGEIYGREEMLAPSRMVTATVASDSRLIRRVPVKTTGPLLKGLIPQLLEGLRTKTVQVPAKCGDTLISNFCDSGIDVVLTRSITE